MIEFSIENGLLILRYSPQSPWITREFETNDDISLKKTFTFTRADPLDGEVDENMEETRVRFVLGRLVGEYFRIESRVLSTRFPVFLYREVHVERHLFLAARNTSIFKKIGSLVSEDPYIGGEHEGAIPLPEFEEIVRALPNEYEIKNTLRRDSVLF